MVTRFLVVCSCGFWFLGSVETVGAQTVAVEVDAGSRDEATSRSIYDVRSFGALGDGVSLDLCGDGAWV